ncbi:hypothetical protein [Burkholderia territorii]|uniref:hypothetical protein n=1 Tax=Burkholderia territorii TaxID=1503055 RepID=UPI0007BA9D1E|nr:hypothetical protein [Burkholderia territorii]
MVANGDAHRHALSFRRVTRAGAESPIAKPVRFRAPRYHRGVSQRALVQGPAFFRNAGRHTPADFYPDPP